LILSTTSRLALRATFNADELSQMPIRERNTGPGFQIAFKSNRAPFVGEFNDNVNRPRTYLAVWAQLPALCSACRVGTSEVMPV
jgi:hypothetical protein